MRRIGWLVIWLLPLTICIPPSVAQAQSTIVVGTCGTLASPLPVNSHGQPLYLDTTGVLCTNASGGGGGAVTIANGADAVLGSLTDAASCASGTTATACLRQIDADIKGSIPAGTNLIGNVGLNAVASGGWTPKWFVAANSDNATNLKASAGIVHAVQVFGIGSAPAYLKFYDKASSPTCGSDTIVKQIMIPAASTAANGSGAIAVTLDTQFSTGISYCVVTGITAADDTSPSASTFVINIDWH